MKKLLYLLAFAVFMASCNTNANQGGGAIDQIAKNKAVVQRFYDDIVNKHNAALIDSIFSADFADHSPDPGYAPTRDGLKKDFTDFFTAFPDVSVKVNIVTADSNTVTAQITWAGTNSGPMMKMPATNKKINIDGIDLLRVKDGKITEHWGYFEERKMMTQLGLMPDPSDTTAMKTEMKEMKMEAKEVEKKMKKK